MNRNILRILVVMLIVVLLTGCASWFRECDTVPSGGDTPTLDESPASGKKLDEAKKEVEIDQRLLELCLVPLPTPQFGAGHSVDAIAVKKAETSLYYECAYRHNALVQFLLEKLKIVPAKDTN